MTKPETTFINRYGQEQVRASMPCLRCGCRDDEHEPEDKGACMECDCVGLV